MKKMSINVLVVIALVGSASWARTQIHELGRTRNATACAQLAASRGYNQYQFGGISESGERDPFLCFGVIPARFE